MMSHYKMILSEFECMSIINHIILGMKSLNDENIWHRDIKPENILLNNG